jgi:hypothetical protein
MKHPFRQYSPAALCLMDKNLVRTIADNGNSRNLATSACLTILIGSMIYGAAFGAWRAPTQALFSAVKMPALIFSVTLASSIINVMLAQVLGSGLSYRQVWLCILTSLAIACALLGAISPVLFFFIMQVPPPEAPNAMSVYNWVLLTNTTIVGIAGIIGNVRLYRLLRTLTKSPAMAARVLTSWILVSGLTGCELSWILSPFLAKPGIPIPLINPDAFNGNFFEYVFRALGFSLGGY